MLRKSRRNQAAGRRPPELQYAHLAADCVAREGSPVRVKALVTYLIGRARGPVAKSVRRVPGAQRDLSALVQDIFTRSLRSVMANAAWDEMIRNRQELIERICAASTPEMDGLGLRIDSLQIQSLDFSEKSEALAALRAASAAERREK